VFAAEQQSLVLVLSQIMYAHTQVIDFH
jgi:hypothetical protein